MWPAAWYKAAGDKALVMTERCTVEHNGWLPGKLSPELAHYPPGLWETSERDRYEHCQQSQNYLGIKRNTEDRNIGLEPISAALDRVVQSDTSVISETVRTWKDSGKTYQRPKTRKGPLQSSNDRFQLFWPTY